MKHLLTLLATLIVTLGKPCFASAEPAADLRAGTLHLPNGYTHQHRGGLDSQMGKISRANGKFTIHYDIGMMAGYHMRPDRKGACSWYQEQMINGCIACLGITETKNSQLLEITIYDSPAKPTGEPANFTATITTREDLADALLLVGSFKFKRTPPAAAQDGAAATRVAPCVVLTGTNSHVSERGYCRATSLEQWTEIWQEHAGQDPGQEYDLYFNPAGLPGVDFDRFMVIAVFQGAGWNSAGLTVASIAEQPERILFRFDDKSYQTEGPDGGGKRVTVYGFFVLPRSAKPLVLEENVQGLLGGPPVWRERITFPRLTNSLAIHLLSEPVDRHLTLRGQSDWSRLRLSPSPRISAADIVSYDFTDHSVRLRPDALARIP